MQGLEGLYYEKMEGSIKTLFIACVVVVTGVLLTIQTVINVNQLQSNIEEQVMNSLEHQAGAIAGKLDQRILQIEQKTRGLAMVTSNYKTYDMDVMMGLGKDYIESDPLIVGSGYWFEPSAYQEDMKYFGPYQIRRPGGKIEMTMEYSNESYDYLNQEYYKMGMQNPGKVNWEGPYRDNSSGLNMMSNSAGFTKEGKAAGVVTVTMGIDELEKFVQDIKVGANGYAFMVSQDGYYLASKDESKNMQVKITEESNKDLEALGAKAQSATELTLVESDAFGENAYVMMAPLCVDNLKLVLVAPESDYTGPITHAKIVSVIMAIIVMIVLCAALIVVFNRRVSAPITDLMDKAGQIAAGDLRGRVEIRSNDEMGSLGGSLNHMIDNLREVIGKVNGMSEQVAAASEELTASADQSALASNMVADSVVNIAEGTSVQAVEAGNIQAKAEGVTTFAQELVSDTKSVLKNAVEAKEKINDGRQSIKEAVQQMNNITASTDSIQNSIGKLDSSSKQIADIVQMITGIAEQTNLLALNAAIEAARAGDAGRGFAVVADEVRKLAESSNQSSQQIAQLVQSNMQDMVSAVEASDSGAKSVQEGIETVTSADVVFQDIVRVIDALTEQIERIATGLDKMAKENEGMLHASTKIAETSGKNSDDAQSVSAAGEEQSASMHEISDASRSLAEMAADLQAEMQKFKL